MSSVVYHNFKIAIFIKIFKLLHIRRKLRGPTTSKMEFFVALIDLKEIIGWKSIMIVTKNSILDVVGS